MQRLAQYTTVAQSCVYSLSQCEVYDMSSGLVHVCYRVCYHVCYLSAPGRFRHWPGECTCQTVHTFTLESPLATVCGIPGISWQPMAANRCVVTPAAAPQQVTA